MDDTAGVPILTLWGMFLHLKKSRNMEIQMKRRISNNETPRGQETSVLASFPESTNSVLGMRNLRATEHHLRLLNVTPHINRSRIELGSPGYSFCSGQHILLP